MADLNALAEMARKNPEMMGTGLAGIAQSEAQIENEYKKHVIEAAQNGEDPMDRETFIRMFRGG